HSGQSSLTNSWGSVLISIVSVTYSKFPVNFSQNSLSNNL
ncbi:hypothetical protein CP02DC14_1369, partial [Chlamydia psittaci 02DC14]